MKALGRALGRLLEPGDVVGLVGPLGAGKTTFAQGVAEGLQVPSHRHVASPTFALVNEHPGRVPFVHADLYRVENAAELVEIGLADLFDRSAAIIEWIDRFPEAAPADHLNVSIAVDGEAVAASCRTLDVRPKGTRAEHLTRDWVSAAGCGGGI